jgi:hypothetical protein
MLPQAGGVWTFEISVGEQTLLQQLVCQNTGLGESPHCAAHLKVNEPVFSASLSKLYCIHVHSGNNANGIFIYLYLLSSVLR